MSRGRKSAIGLVAAIVTSLAMLAIVAASVVAPVSATSTTNAAKGNTPVASTTANGYTLTALSPISIRTDFYGGATIPVKFTLTDQNGNIVSDAQATIWVNGAAGTASGNSNSGNSFRYDTTAMMYIYNLNTKPYPAGPGSPTSTITIKAIVGDTTLMESFVVSLD
jgi:hypothetical protein